MTEKALLEKEQPPLNLSRPIGLELLGFLRALLLGLAGTRAGVLGSSRGWRAADERRENEN